MPRNIQLSYPTPLQEGVLIPRQAFHEGQYAERLTDHARSRARHVVADAQSQAHLIRRQAYADGYSDGLAEALQDMFTHFQDAEKLHRDIQRRLLEKFQVELENLLGNSEFIDVLFDQWIAEQSATEEKKMAVLLPPLLGHQREKFSRRIAQHGQFTASVGVAAHPCFTIEHGEFVHEFDQAKFMDEMYPEVLACFKKLELQELVTQVSGKSVRDFINRLHLEYGVCPALSEPAVETSAPLPMAESAGRHAAPDNGAQAAKSAGLAKPPEPPDQGSTAGRQYRTVEREKGAKGAEPDLPRGAAADVPVSDFRTKAFQTFGPQNASASNGTPRSVIRASDIPITVDAGQYARSEMDDDPVEEPGDEPGDEPEDELEDDLDDVLPDDFADHFGEIGEVGVDEEAASEPAYGPAKVFQGARPRVSAVSAQGTIAGPAPVQSVQSVQSAQSVQHMQHVQPARHPREDSC